MKDKILISEVGPRDGLQNCKGVMPTDVKKRWVKGLYDAGVREIEVGSFVPPKLFPQLADTAEIVAFAKTLPGLTVLALIPNFRGAQAALDAGVDAVTLPLSASETHSLKNMRQTHDQVIENVKSIRTLFDASSNPPRFEAGVSTAFGCSIEGHVPEAKVISLGERLVEAGVDELGLSDTVGYANPLQIKSMIKSMRDAVGQEKVKSVHLHNTYGLGIANAFSAYEEGIEVFDSSQGGLGGCPASPGASGNIVTEDLVYMFEAMGVDTGIDLDHLMACRKYLEEGLPGEPVYGFTPNAGLPKTYSVS
ncbi:hydroxymethylglutaryl-CoA lyase [Litorimonas taeanensis]|uniref:Hydroxymethylglutaryl-CoA lyase n=1 Tax=Litorimonas taeanensis TaxID=568099 RepID=A0A420WLQ2_9PROT|nr:hydroxymethylglutaryl-CoA lyase [Litorimonas taeanensis]RKQ71953.1 hydroxymethylglutaryl-CoA lyase [Litorimonas taeanensis]